MTGEAIGYHDSAGYRLRCAREQLSLSIRDVARALKLLASHVRAIEADRCDALAKDDQFVRRLEDYANLVDLNPNDVVDSYRSQSAAVSVQPPPQPVTAKVRPGNRGPWIAVGVFALLGLGMEIWLIARPSPLESGISAVSDKQSTADSPVEQLQLPSKQQSAPETSSEHSLTADKPSQSVAAEEAGTPTRLRSTEWFASQPADRYTVQLFSVRDEDSTRAFIVKHQLEDKAAYFSIRRNNETWYAVTYGLYDSHKKAEAASKTLPENLKHLKPWVRNTGLIQQSMLR